MIRPRRLWCHFLLALLVGALIGLTMRYTDVQAESRSNDGDQGQTFMRTGNPGVITYYVDMSASTTWINDTNYSIIRTYNNSAGSGWHEVDRDSCSFASNTSFYCQATDLIAGSVQDRATERRGSTRHIFWWNGGSQEFYTSARHGQGQINNWDGRYSSYNCVYYALC